MADYKNIYAKLVAKCEEAGTDITKVCRDAGVDRSIVERWKDKDPKTIVILAQLEKAIAKAKKKRDNVVASPVINKGSSIR